MDRTENKRARTVVPERTIELENCLPAAYMPKTHSDSKCSNPEQTNVILGCNGGKSLFQNKTKQHLPPKIPCTPKSTKIQLIYAKSSSNIMLGLNHSVLVLSIPSSQDALGLQDSLIRANCATNNIDPQRTCAQSASNVILSPCYGVLPCMCHLYK